MPPFFNKSPLAKKVRVADRKYLDSVRLLPCVICDSSPCDPDHITSKGAGGSDTPTNIWPLCRQHHTERHSIGLTRVVKKYLNLQIWLEKNGRHEILIKAGIINNDGHKEPSN